MRQRTRKLIGTVVMLLYLFVYALLAMVVGAQVVPRSSALTEFLFYLVAGLAWVPLAGLLVTWMQRPDDT